MSSYGFTPPVYGRGLFYYKPTSRLSSHCFNASSALLLTDRKRHHHSHLTPVSLLAVLNANQRSLQNKPSGGVLLRGISTQTNDPSLGVEFQFIKSLTCPVDPQRNVGSSPLASRMMRLYSPSSFRVFVQINFAGKV